MSSVFLNAFKAAAWPAEPDITAFIRSNLTVPASQLGPALEYLLNKQSLAEPTNHRKRCNVFAALAAGKSDAALLGAMVKALKPGDTILRGSLTQALSKVEDVDVVTQVAALLSSTDAALKQHAVHILSTPRHPASLQGVRNLFKDKGCTCRAEAMEILIRANGHHAISFLKDVMPQSKPPERVGVLKLLGEPKLVGRDTQSALKLLATQLAEPLEDVCRAAVTSFCAICTEEEWFGHVAPLLERDNMAVSRPALEGLKRFNSPRVFVTLEHRLRAGPNALRFAVLNALEGIGTSDVLGILVEALGHKQLPVRTRAGEIFTALSKSGKLDLARTIIWLLRSPNVNVRRQAVELAKTVKDPNNELWPKLLVVLRDQDWWVRERLADVLVEMAGSHLTRHIVSYLTEPSEIVRRWAVDVLVRLKDPSSLGALVRAAQSDADWWVKERALEAIGQVNDKRAVPYLLDLLQRDHDTRVACMQALQQLRATEALPAAVEFLKDEASEVRYGALLLIEELGDASLAESVRALTTDVEPIIRSRARALGAKWNLQMADGSTAKQNLSALDRLLAGCAEHHGDDMLLAPDRPVFIKRLGSVVPLTKQSFTAEQVQALLVPMLNDTQLKALDAHEDIDFSYEVKSEGLRFRVNLFRESHGIAAVFRIIKGHLPKVEDLGLPKKIVDLADLKNGLVLIGGPTGSGKSTTLAVLIDHINRTSGSHIICLEDPIEVIHNQQKGLVTQRELGAHTQSFGSSLRATLREDPDVILVGELRDLATIQFAVTAAETGHLVFGTVHTVAADTSIDRVINAFPGTQQDQVRSMLAESLRAVVCQYLIKTVNGTGRALALEYMLNNDAISSLIRKGKAYQIQSVIATSKEEGMQLMDSDLMRLFKEGKISGEEAFMKARSKKEFEQVMNPDGAKNDKAADAKAPPEGKPARERQSA